MDNLLEMKYHLRLQQRDKKKFKESKKSRILMKWILKNNLTYIDLWKSLVLMKKKQNSFYNYLKDHN